MGHKDVKGRSFSIFRSAGEEAEMRKCEEPLGKDEGGHMSCTSGRIVSSHGAQLPFKAVMTREGGDTFEVNGLNHFSMDIESSVERCHRNIVPGGR